MTDRNEYVLNLSGYLLADPPVHASEYQIRTVQTADASLLAELMVDAYRDTIDYDGETFDDALSEVNAFLAGERGGQPCLQMSFLAFADSHLVGACLTSEWHERQAPIIAYVMTSANWKKHGLGRLLLHRALKALIEKGYAEARAVITDGNQPSENLFLQFGFQRIEHA